MGAPEGRAHTASTPAPGKDLSPAACRIKKYWRNLHAGASLDVANY